MLFPHSSGGDPGHICALGPCGGIHIDCPACLLNFQKKNCRHVKTGNAWAHLSCRRLGITQTVSLGKSRACASQWTPLRVSSLGTQYLVPIIVLPYVKCHT